MEAGGGPADGIARREEDIMNESKFRQRLADLLERKRREAETEAAKIQKKPPAAQKLRPGA
jgi:hypothetical protein